MHANAAGDDSGSEKMRHVRSIGRQVPPGVPIRDQCVPTGYSKCCARRLLLLIFKVPSLSLRNIEGELPQLPTAKLIPSNGAPLRRSCISIRCGPAPRSTRLRDSKWDRAPGALW